MKETGIYEALAPFYDRLNGEVDYEAIADDAVAQFDRYFPGKVREVLDLGCGTGSLTLALARRGYDMTGMDISPEMLAVAQNRMYEQELSGILWTRQDMRHFELYGTVDAVVCSLDGVNHLTETADLRDCLHWVYHYLVPDGLFLFDVNSVWKFEHIYGNEAYILEDEGVLCAWQNRYCARSHLCRFDISLFEERADGLYRRRSVSQSERCYPLPTLKRLLGQAGFELLSVRGAMDRDTVREQDERWYITARALKIPGKSPNSTKEDK